MTMARILVQQVPQLLRHLLQLQQPLVFRLEILEPGAKKARNDEENDGKKTGSWSWILVEDG